MVDEEPEKKAARVSEIKKKFAFSQFSKRHFETAMEAFAELDIDPPHVIGLYPELLPMEIRSVPVLLTQCRRLSRCLGVP